MTVIDSRLADFETITLAKGQHDSPDDGGCLVEWASWLAGELWSDHPECVCPVLGAFGRAWNDQLDDDARQWLKPYAARLVGTRSPPEVEASRAWLACDWLVRTFTPTWLRLAKLDDDAAELEALDELTSVDLVTAALPVIDAAKENALAARDAAGAAAGDAAWAAAGAAAGDAVWAAVWAAARDAAWAALEPTVLALQTSAFELLDRMIAVA